MNEQTANQNKTVDQYGNARITLKNIKVAEFASEETYCFTASVYLDGKRFGVAHNDGHGGQTWFRPYMVDDKTKLAEAEAYAEALPPMDCSDLGFTAPLLMTLNTLVDSLLEDHIQAKAQWVHEADMKRQCRTKIVLKENGEYYTLAVKTGVSVTNTQRWSESVQRQYPNATIMNLQWGILPA